MRCCICNAELDKFTLDNDIVYRCPINCYLMIQQSTQRIEEFNLFLQDMPTFFTGSQFKVKNTTIFQQGKKFCSSVLYINDLPSINLDKHIAPGTVQLSDKEWEMIIDNGTYWTDGYTQWHGFFNFTP